MEYITLDVFLRALHDSQNIMICDVTGEKLDELRGIPVIFSGRVADIEYKISKDFDSFRITDFFSTPRDSITVKVVRIPNLKMVYRDTDGFEVYMK